MSERKTRAIQVMFNSFPQQAGDAKLRLSTYLHLVSELSDGAVLETCRRFSAGECGRDADQHNFPPTSAQFVRLAKDCEAQIRLAANPPIAAPVEIKRSASWHKMRDKVQRAIGEYRRTYAEALKSNPKLKYIDHILAEHKRNTGRDLKITRPAE